MWYRNQSVILAVGVAVLAACGDTTDPDPTNPEQVSQQIGPTGGTITSGDSNLTLTIPPGALSGDVTITIAPLAVEDLGPEWDGLPVVAAYALGPDGTTFGVPVEVSLRSDQVPIRTDSTTAVHAELLLASSNGVLEGLDSVGIEVDAAGLTVRGRLSHFSVLGDLLLDLLFGGEGLDFDVAGDIPAVAYLGQPFLLTATITATGALADVFARIAGVDAGLVEIEGMFSVVVSGALQVTPAGDIVGPLSNGVFTATKTFSCTEPGSAMIQQMPLLVRVRSPQGEEFGMGGLFQPADVECAEPPLTLTIEKTGEGLVTDQPVLNIDCGLDCSGRYFVGDSVTLLATPAEGWGFVQWSTDCSGTSEQTGLRLTEDATCHAEFAPLPTGPAIMIYDDVQFDFTGDHFTLAPGNTRALVSPRTGTGLYEVNLESLSDVTVSDDHPNMCPGAPLVADDPVVGRLAFVFGVETTQGCFTQYPPLDFAVGLFNVGSSTGDVATFNGLGQYARAAFSAGVLHIQTVGAVAGTYVELTPGLTSCPRYLWTVGTVAFVTTEEGTPGTSTEACAATAGLYRVDLLTGTVTGSLLIGDGLRGLAVTADGTLAYLSDYVANALHVVNAQTMQPVRSIPVPGGLVDVALSDDGSLLVGALFDADAVALVDLATDVVVGTVPARGVNPTRLRGLGNDRFILLDFGNPGSGIMSRLETLGIVRP